MTCWWSTTARRCRPAFQHRPGDLNFIVHFATDYGAGTWLIEPRWSAGQPGPLPLSGGDRIALPTLTTRLIAPYPGLDRLWFAHFDGDVRSAMARSGSPIRYGYVPERYPLTTYQTVFARNPGSAEMPSAAYPFTLDVVRRLRERGIGLAPITLHTGVSSLEVNARSSRITPCSQSHTLFHPRRPPRSTPHALRAAA